MGFWAAARKAHGDAAGTRALVEVLLLHRRLDHAEVLAGITAALAVGSTNPDVVALEARKASEHAPTGAGADSDPGAEVLDLVARRAELPADCRPMPCLDKYDALLDKESS